MKNILLIGAGEVGSAIKQIEEEAGNKVEVIDKSPKYAFKSPVSNNFFVAHVCMPFSKSFNHDVLNYVRTHPVKLIIIHSTVFPGTTELVRKETGIPTVHSPVRGVHPDLTKGIKTFVKYISGTPEDVGLASVHLTQIGLTVCTVENAKQTEIGKILSTTYYGWNILFAKLVKELCDKYNVDFNLVYTHFNMTYNMGYANLEKPNVIRPVLYPPTGIISGHCVTQNFEHLPEGKLKKICKELNDDKTTADRTNK